MRLRTRRRPTLGPSRERLTERVRLQQPPHSESDAESSIDRPGHAEAAREVEPFRVGITNDMQKAGRVHASNFCNVVHKATSNPLLPEVRLDEQSVQLCAAVGARYHSRKTDDDRVAFCDEDAASSNLLDR
jgi:hypothetical protein